MGFRHCTTRLLGGHRPHKTRVPSREIDICYPRGGGDPPKNRGSMLAGRRPHPTQVAVCGVRAASGATPRVASRRICRGREAKPPLDPAQSKVWRQSLEKRPARRREGFCTTGCQASIGPQRPPVTMLMAVSTRVLWGRPTKRLPIVGFDGDTIPSATAPATGAVEWIEREGETWSAVEQLKSIVDSR